MSDIQYAYPLILNKVASPHYATPTLRRARLLDWLHAAAKCRASVLAADAGYGKTTLLWQWEREVGFPCYWYKLDRNDRDWSLHVSYLIEAISQRHNGFGRRAHSMLQQLGGPGSSRPGVAAYLLAEMHERLTEPCTFIIDDWQYVNAVTEVRGLWNQILRDAPPTCRFVFASRAKPKLQFARFKTHEGYAELKTDALRFTEAEIDELFRDIYDDPLDPSELAELERRTEGWAASLQLVEVSLRERRSPDARREFIRSITGESDSDLFEFLAEEVLDQQPEETRNFLMSTSILQQVTPELAERLAGVHDGVRALLDLEHRGLFTYRLDGHRYRYHHLFREFLERRLAAEQSEAEVTALHIHAASYFETVEQWPSAIHHYMRARLQRQAARLLARYGEELVGEGRLGLIDSWLQELPSRAIRENARLSLLEGEADGFRGEWDNAIDALARSLEFFVRKGDKRMQALACVKLSSTYHYQGQVEASAEFAMRGLQLLPDDAVALRLRLEGNLALTHGWLHESFAEIAKSCKRIALEASSRGLDHFAAIAFHNLGVVQRYMGNFEESAMSLERASSFWGEPATTPFGDNHELVLTLLTLERTAQAERVADDAISRTVPWQRASAEAQAGAAAVMAHQGRFIDASHAYGELYERRKELGTASELVGACLIDCLHLSRADGQKIQAVAEAMRASPSDPRHAPTVQVALAIASHATGNCKGGCLSAISAVERWDGRGADYAATSAMMRIATLALDHSRQRRDRIAIKALERCRDRGLIRHFKWWLRRYTPQVEAIASLPTGAELLADLVDADPEGWRVAAVRGLAQTAAGERSRLLTSVVRNANRHTPRLLKTVAGDDVSDVRRALIHQQATRLYVRTLGGLQVHRGSWDGPSIGIDKRRVRMLLALLSAHTGKGLTRDEVLDTLWPEADPSAAVNSLNQSVFQLRRQLDPDYRDGDAALYVLSSADSVQLNFELVRTDIDELRRLFRLVSESAPQDRRREITAMVDLVRGEFLSQLRYEDWVTQRQLDIHSEVREMLLPLAERTLAHETPDLAVRAANALTRLDAFDERAFVALAKALAASGRRNSARDVLAQFADRLRSELDDAPSPIVTDALSAIAAVHD